MVTWSTITKHNVLLNKQQLHKMKKQLLSIFAALTVGTAIAQTTSPSWNIIQNAAFTQTAAGIRYIDAVDNNVCWVLGYDGSGAGRNRNWVSRTTNGGTNWTPGLVYASPTNTLYGDTANFVPANLEGIDGNIGWVCAFQKGPAPYSPTNQGGGVIHRTTNGGANWTNMTATGMFTNTTDAFADFVTFLTPSVGVAVGDPVAGVYEIWRTTNGGLSWAVVPSANIPAPLSATEFAIVNLYTKQGTSNIWFGTNQGRIYYSTNSGQTWSVSVAAANTTTITEIAFNSANNGVAFGFNSGQTFEMYNTTDGGVTWNPINTISPNVGQNDITGVPGTNYFVSGGAGTNNQIISYSTDNGVTWTDYGSVGYQYLVLDFATNTTGWAGSFSDLTNPSVGGIFKYSGAAFTSTALASSAFAITPNVCLTGPSVVVVPTNSSTGSPAPTFSWSASPAGPVFSSASASTPSVTFSSSGTYTITLLTTNSTGTNSSTQVITVNACSLPTPSITTNVSTVCNNGNLTTNNVTTGGSPAPSYSWSAVPATGVTFSPSAIALNPSIKIATPGSYVITMMATNNQGSVSDSKTITVNNCAPIPSFSIPAVFYKCEPGNRLVTANSTTLSNGANTYTWSIQPSSGVSIAPPGVNAPNITANITNTAITVYTVTLRATNLSGTATPVTQTLSVDFFCLGVGDNSLDSKLTVYPNPAHDQLSITLPSTIDTYEVKLVNVLGDVVLNEKVTNNNKESVNLNLSNQPKGVYFLSIEANREKVTRKIIIE